MFSILIDGWEVRSETPLHLARVTSSSENERPSREDYASEAFRREHAMKAAWSALDRNDIPGAYDALDID